MAKKDKAAKEQRGELFLITRIEYKEEAKNPNNAYHRSGNVGRGFKGMFMKADYKAYKLSLIHI
jgi:hypothetical protein